MKSSSDITKGHVAAAKLAISTLQSSIKRYGSDEWVSRPEVERARDIIEEMLDVIDCLEIPLPKKSAQENLTNAV